MESEFNNMSVELLTVIGMVKMAVSGYKMNNPACTSEGEIADYVGKLLEERTGIINPTWIRAMVSMELEGTL